MLHLLVQAFSDFDAWQREHPPTRVAHDALDVAQALVERHSCKLYIVALGWSCCALAELLQLLKQSSAPITGACAVEPLPQHAAKLVSSCDKPSEGACVLLVQTKHDADQQTELQALIAGHAQGSVEESDTDLWRNATTQVAVVTSGYRALLEPGMQAADCNQMLRAIEEHSAAAYARMQHCAQNDPSNT